MTKDGYLNFRLRPEAAEKARWLQNEIPARYEAATGVRPPTPSVPVVMETALTALVGAHKGTLVIMSVEKYNLDAMENMAAFAAVVLKPTAMRTSKCSPAQNRGSSALCSMARPARPWT